jgi:hypothetical protein
MYQELIYLWLLTKPRARKMIARAMFFDYGMMFLVNDPSMQLNIEPQDLYFFDMYLRELLFAKPVNSLRSNGTPTEKPKGIQLIYEVTIKKNGKDTVIEIKLIATQKNIEPLQIRAIKFDSIEEKETLTEMLI